MRATNLGPATHAASNGQREENRCHGALPTMERSARIAGAAHVLRTYVIERGGARRTVPVGPVLVRSHLDRGVCDVPENGQLAFKDPADPGLLDQLGAVGVVPTRTLPERNGQRIPRKVLQHNHL